jgi:hypothetical protein
MSKLKQIKKILKKILKKKPKLKDQIYMGGWENQGGNYFDKRK